MSPKKMIGLSSVSYTHLTLPMWKKLDAVMDNYLSSVSVQDLLDGKA